MKKVATRNGATFLFLRNKAMVFNGKIKDISGMRSGKLVAIKPINSENRFGDEKIMSLL